MTITHEEFFNALRWIDSQDEKHWPHHLLPGAYLDKYFCSHADANSPLQPTEEAWNAYQYNPNPYTTSYSEWSAADTSSDVRAKPSWSEITSAVTGSEKDALLYQYRKLILLEEQERITKGYIGDQGVSLSADQEIFYRLRAPASELAPKDTERNRLHGKATRLMEWLKDSSRTLAELQAFNPSADSHWAADDAQEDE